MRSNILTLGLIAGMTLGGAAFAGTTTAKTPAVTPAVTAVSATTVAGTITKIDVKKDYVVLSDHWRYHLPAGFALKDFKVGEKVSITYGLKGRYRDVTAMTAA